MCVLCMFSQYLSVFPMCFPVLQCVVSRVPVCCPSVFSCFPVSCHLKTTTEPQTCDSSTSTTHTHTAHSHAHLWCHPVGGAHHILLQLAVVGLQLPQLGSNAKVR